MMLILNAAVQSTQPDYVALAMVLVLAHSWVRPSPGLSGGWDQVFRCLDSEKSTRN